MGIEEDALATAMERRDRENQEAGAGMAELAGKYLTFRLSKEEYGIEILKVKEILKLMDITTVPRTPDYVRGVINLRGKVIPVVDLRKKFGMEGIEDTDETCIIWVAIEKDGQELYMGMLVDTVSEVLDIEGADIEPAPQFGREVSTDYIMGMAKSKGEVKILLDVEKILAGEEDLQTLTQA